MTRNQTLGGHILALLGLIPLIAGLPVASPGLLSEAGTLGLAIVVFWAGILILARGWWQ